MPTYLATCSDLETVVCAPDEAAARPMAVWVFRQLERRWWGSPLHITPVVKTCTTCGRALIAAEWEHLHYVGRQEFDDGEQPEAVELRDCPCGNTLAIEIYSSR